MAIEMKNTKVKISKPIYLGMSILDISKTLMYDFGMITLNQISRQSKTMLHGYWQVRYSYKTEGFYEDIANDVEMVWHI